ncbi:MAG: hypothetical protein P1U56_18930 [Saprospiraceae bacterium]|nr:hypothetical protein [Saprospiraceae bacterium]
MKKAIFCCIGILIFTIIACSDNDRFDEVEIPDFDFPSSVVFEDSLSSYSIFQGEPADLNPSTDFQLLELSSILFTDYAHKQRLVKLPVGTQMRRLNDGSIDFPDGTILSKTFYYYNDERDITLGKRIIETRLLIKENDIWNVATYQWNETQTNAVLELNGRDTQVSWIDVHGNSNSTLYHIPDENECIACHQSNSTMIPLGTKLRNLNRIVERNGESLNQINYLQSVGMMDDFQVSLISNIVDYNDETNTLAERGRAYLDLNCSHCHNPTAWEVVTERDFDFRYETPENQTGILFEKDKIKEALLDSEMPFIGTTTLDLEGLDLVIEYIDSL